MIRDGRLPSVKIGRSRRVRSADLAAYVAKLAVVQHHE
jgi:excisionase family DNA binding protein